MALPVHSTSASDQDSLITHSNRTRNTDGTMKEQPMWLGGVVVRASNCDQEVMSLTAGHALSCPVST